jgi:hypothetical protein
MIAHKELGIEKVAFAPLLKAEVKRVGLIYDELAERIEDKEINVRNKLLRGKFSGSFLLQRLHAVGQRDLRL